ncbi:hypothetical protein C8R44DRAFT_759446 [Mycena epipterygia]|nr:hypothetical protein C8R44DRAFT_759446 [Mycena epipterygia]
MSQLNMYPLPLQPAPARAILIPHPNRQQVLALSAWRLPRRVGQARPSRARMTASSLALRGTRCALSARGC